MFGGCTGFCAASDKKAQNGSSLGLHAIPPHAATATECDEKKTKQNKTKKQKGHASYWNFEYMYSIGR